MNSKWFAGTAAVGLLAYVLPVHAGDVHRLSLPARTADAPTVGLVDNGQGADTVSIHGHGGYGYGHGGYGYGRGGYGYGRGGYGYGYGGYGYGRGGYGGYGYGRGYYGGYGYGGGYYGGYGRGYYGGYGYGRGYYGGYGYGYYPSYCYAPVVSYYQPYYYTTPVYSIDPCLYSSGVTASALNLSVTVTPTVRRGTVLTTRQRVIEVVAAPKPVDEDDQTFPYDGGPREPAPMPRAEPASDVQPSVAPVKNPAVSLPVKVANKLVYPAYGEQAALPEAPRVQDESVLVKRTK